ncbi:hypothetical protein [Prevotella sp.]|uniref:hypothetical protein n=1 Tax=Prevotella sp. TaxID=59823 RepID=UPI002A835BF2|nr:hypothetical protein [Prevotella sp.]MDY4645847.1 hypothetical protein [Prevotella sp.]
MKLSNKLNSLLVAPLAIALFAACSTDENLSDGGVQSQRLIIHATSEAGDGTRTDYSDADGKYTAKWNTNDVVTIFASSKDKNGKFTVSKINDAEAHSADLTGSINEKLTAKTEITGYIHNSNVNAVNNGVVDANGVGTQLQVDYSEQKGTFEDAMSRNVLFGKGTYDPANGNELSMKFEYLTTFLKLTLDFGDNTLNSTASLLITGDNLLSMSRVNTAGNNAGKTNYTNGGTITVSPVTIVNGKAVVYVALYARELSNVKLCALFEDGSAYNFDISNSVSANLKPGIIYDIQRTGVKADMAEATSYASGTGTEADPYIIETVGQLKYMEKMTQEDKYFYNGKFFKLDNDLTINGEWTPIGTNDKPFRGNFDGDGHTIYGNLKFTGVVQNGAVGLFGFTGNNAVIKNLTNRATITSTYDNGANFTGAIVGRALNNLTMQNCSNYGVVKGGTSFVGGLIGKVDLTTKNQNYTTIIEACHNEGNVTCTYTGTASSSVGGIVGVVNGNINADPVLEVKGCYNRNVILSSDKTGSIYSAGILGLVQNAKKDAAQVKVIACWVDNTTLAQKGNRAAIIASGNAADIYYSVSNCWTSLDRVVIAGDKITGNNVVVTNCIVKKTKALKDFVSDMNKAWGSTAYEFNADGTIKTK